MQCFMATHSMWPYDTYTIYNIVIIDWPAGDRNWQKEVKRKRMDGCPAGLSCRRTRTHTLSGGRPTHPFNCYRQ